MALDRTVSKAIRDQVSRPNSLEFQTGIKNRKTAAKQPAEPRRISVTRAALSGSFSSSIDQADESGYPGFALASSRPSPTRTVARY